MKNTGTATTIVLLRIKLFQQDLAAISEVTVSNEKSSFKIANYVGFLLN